MLDLLNYQFFQNALITGLLASIACGIIGSYVIINRIVFISGGISHTAFGGIGMGYYLGIKPIVGAFVFSFLSAIIIGIVIPRTKIRLDTIIGIIWAFGMALGIIFISLTENYSTDLMSYLFGNILMVPYFDIFLMIILDIIIIIAIIAFYKDFLAISFDKEYAFIKGLPINFLLTILYILISLTVIMLIRCVGIILVIAMLTFPATLSNFITKDLSKMMGLSILFGIIFTWGGLFISYYFNIPSGATIILLSTVVLLFAGSIRIFNKRRIRNKA